MLPDSAFSYDDPNNWTAPLNDAADIAAGQALWNGAQLTDISGKPILAACGNCHASDGRDLKYFNYSNWAIEARSMAHGLTLNQGQQIASYIRSLDLALPSGLTQHDLGRPWNPPYQPGPGLDSKPVEAWAAGAGIDWVLDNDNSMLPYMFPNGTSGPDAETRTSTKYALNPREIPIAMPFQDWNHWLPITHPMDSAYKVTATSDVRDSWNKSNFIRQYNYVVNLLSQPALVSSLMAQTHANMLAGNCAEGILTQIRAFNPWYLENDTSSSFKSTANKDLPNLDFMSGRQLFMVRMWELHQRFKLEGHGKDVFGFPGGGHDRTWFFNDWTAFGVSPHISTDGQNIYPYDTELKEKLASSVWYQIQLTINSGNKVAVPGYPMDWNYQSNHVDGVGLLSGHYHGLQLLLGEIIGMQEAAGTNAWEQCGTTTPGRFYYAPKNHIPSRAIFEPGEVCVGPDYMQLDPTVWRDITQLMTKAFVAQINERNPSQFPRVDTATNTTLESASYVPTFDPNHPLCGVNDVSIGGNIYRSLLTMKNIGVDPTVIESLATWGKAMWPLGNWDYWK